MLAPESSRRSAGSTLTPNENRYRTELLGFIAALRDGRGSNYPNFVGVTRALFGSVPPALVSDDECPLPIRFKTPIVQAVLRDTDFTLEEAERILGEGPTESKEAASPQTDLVQIEKYRTGLGSFIEKFRRGEAWLYQCREILDGFFRDGCQLPNMPACGGTRLTEEAKGSVVVAILDETGFSATEAAALSGQNMAIPWTPDKEPS